MALEQRVTDLSDPAIAAPADCPSSTADIRMGATNRQLRAIDGFPPARPPRDHALASHRLSGRGTLSVGRRFEAEGGVPAPPDAFRCKQSHRSRAEAVCVQAPV